MDHARVGRVVHITPYSTEATRVFTRSIASGGLIGAPVIYEGIISAMFTMIDAQHYSHSLKFLQAPGKRASSDDINFEVNCSSVSDAHLGPRTLTPCVIESVHALVILSIEQCASEDRSREGYGA